MPVKLHREKNLFKSIRKKTESLREISFAIKKNILDSSVYFFILKPFLSLKTHFLKVKNLFFDSKKAFLIANTFSLRPQLNIIIIKWVMTLTAFIG